jgi:hypothetical protein
MQGPLSTADQVKVLARIWGRDREGFVFLPWIPGWCKDKEERKKNYHEGQAFEWPKDEAKIKAHLDNHPKDDVYFAPCLFLDRRRIEQFAEPERTLWADMDEADPREVDQAYRPTIAWETSPGRYQAIWLLSTLRVGASWADKENHRLTVYLGADPSGWDTTQLLRVPGRANWKPEYPTKGVQDATEGLLWDNGPRYTPDDFEGLPAVTGAAEDLITDDTLGVARIDRHEVWARVRLKVSRTVREYMAIKDLDTAGDADRSEVLWQIERDLADAGCTMAEIVAVVQKTVWNKYAGRQDEIKRLSMEAAKAIKIGAPEKKTSSSSDDDSPLEEPEESTPKPGVQWLTDVMAHRISRPRWLIRNVWSRGGCGFIAGDPKSYKSWVMLDLVTSIATGTPFLNDPQYSVIGGPQPALYVQEEDGEIIVRDRLEQVVEGKSAGQHWHGTMSMGSNGQLIWLPPTHSVLMGFHVRSGFTASDPGWQAWLLEIIGDYKAVFAGIDTLGTTAGGVDTDRAPELMSKILRPLRTISDTTGAAIGVVHHNKKGTASDARGGSRMLGSVALHAWVDDALYVHGREKMPHGRSKVRVERESKSGVDARWVVEIPQMGVTDQFGGRVVWAPVTGQWLDEDPETGEKPVSAGAKRSGTGPVKGAVIANKIKMMGGTTRVVTTEELTGALGKSLGSIQDQLDAAAANGFLEGTVADGWRFVKA